MWEVYEHRRADKSLRKAPAEVLRRYEKWKDIVMISGSYGLRQIKGFHDENLRGEWKGHRSSRLGLGFRIIYRIRAQKVLIEVVDLTAHDYRRK